MADDKDSRQADGITTSAALGNGRLETVDLTEAPEVAKPVEVSEVITPLKLLSFAQVILGGIAGLLLLAAIAHVWIASPQTETVFEFAKTVLPPIATLVIAFYFKGKG